MIMPIKSILLLSGAAWVAFASPVAAQEAPSQANQDIVVTAQRREQNLLDVPLSIQAATGETLNSQGIRDLTSLQLTTPGFMAQTDSGYTQIYIRGIGNSVYIGADPSVATFVDEVPRIYGSMADGLFDVQRVEVLKGAQGGLYGRNATGGVVNIITRQPDVNNFKAEGLLSYGNKETFRGAAYVNLPIAKFGALSFSVERDSHAPYMRNEAPANPYSAANFPGGSTFGTPAQTAAFFNSEITVPKVADQNVWAVNAKLLLKPTDNLKMTFAFDHNSRSDGNGSGMVTRTPAYSQAAVVGLFQSLGINAVLPPGFVQAPVGKFSASFGPTTIIDSKENGGSLTVVWNAPAFDVTSISAYRKQDTVFDANTGSGPLADIPLGVRSTRRMIYQELRGVSTFDGPLRLTFGGTYLDSKIDSETNVYLLSHLIPIAKTVVSDEIHNWSIYAEAGYDFTPDLSLTVSGRYLHETNDAVFSLPAASQGGTRETKFVPAATLSYKLDGGNVYARWARGYKAGGINVITAPLFFPQPTDGSIFKGETVDTYEIGWRQALFDRKVQLTAAVFYNNYSDLQVDGRAQPGFPAITSALINANSARTYGVEGSVSWRVAPSLTLGIDAGYLNARYKDFNKSGSAVLADFNLDGARMVKSPTFQLSMSAGLDQPLSDNLRLVGSALVSHASSLVWQYSAAPGVLPNATSPGYWQTNLRLGVKTTDDRYGLSIAADNLFNNLHYTYGGSNPFGTFNGNATPRIVRAELTFKY
jgi:iron complex outermembrane receptor protein